MVAISNDTPHSLHVVSRATQTWLGPQRLLESRSNQVYLGSYGFVLKSGFSTLAMMPCKFQSEKIELLNSLTQGHDFSPKGTIDDSISHLVELINSLDDYVTTSSCSGRISVYINSKDSKGVHWLLVQHDTTNVETVERALQQLSLPPLALKIDPESTLVYLKCEPMILHVNCISVKSAQKLYTLAMNCGFRESGISLGKFKTIVAIRTTSNGMELPIARGAKLLCSADYLSLIISEANTKILRNFSKLDKLLSLLKSSFYWPRFHVAMSAVDYNEQSEVLKCTGHTSILRNPHEILVSSRAAATSTSKSSEQRHHQQQQQFNPNINFYSIFINASGQHLGVTELSFQPISHHTSTIFKHDIGDILVNIGGRKSPQEAFPVFVHAFILPNDLTQITFSSNNSKHNIIKCESAGDIPAPRWGHSLTDLGCNIHMLFGGRNESALFNDCYLLLLSFTTNSVNGSCNSGGVNDPVLRCKWIKIELCRFSTELSVPESSFKSKIRSRFLCPAATCFHSACSIDWFTDRMAKRSEIYELVHDQIISSNNAQNDPNNFPYMLDPLLGVAQAVLIHGGLTDLSDPHSCNNVLVIYPFRSLTNGITLPIFEYLYSSFAHTIEHPTTIEHLTDVSETINALKYNFELKSELQLYSRFGHSCSDIGMKSYLITGGASFEGTIKSIVIDLGVDDVNNLKIFGINHAVFFQSPKLPFIGESAPAGVASRTTFHTEIDSEIYLPCSRCRIHHTAIVTPHRFSKLYHRSNTELSQLIREADQEPLYSTSTPTLYLIGGGSQCLSFGTHFCTNVAMNIVGGCNRDDSKSSEAHWTKTSVTSTTVVDENISTGIRHEFSNSDNDYQAQQGPVMFVSAQSAKQLKIWLESQNYFDKSRRIASADLTLYRSCDFIRLIDAINLIEIKVATTEAVSVDENVVIMAVPIKYELMQLFQSFKSTPQSKSTAVFTELYKLLQCEIIKFGQQSNIISKTIIADSNKSAKRFLDQFRQKYGISNAAKQSYPQKYELVGDVLMLPEGCFCGPEWKFLSESSTLDPNEMNRRVDLLSGLATCFSVSRIAQKAKIHHGPKRESQVKIIYPIPSCSYANPVVAESGTEAATGPGSEGWTTVVENAIAFSFDITKVMFCSGNVTERMRMATIPANDQVIVDFYCGIGYYTLPFLIHGKARHVHACEWNDNSILALRENLRQNRVEERCTIYPGDNALTAPRLAGIADRICLGLLPTSTKSWKLAVIVAKPQSTVTIHIHENVKDVDIETWQLDTIKEFDSMFRNLNKPMTIEFKHLEKVKSYAPHIFHVVLDILCTPSHALSSKDNIEI